MIKFKCLHCDRITLGIGVTKSHVFSKHGLDTIIGNVEMFMPFTPLLSEEDYNDKWRTLRLQSNANLMVNPNCKHKDGN